jgi:signal transduction histidine kinase/DNA-binding NarL/FixJ family response regulator
MIFLVLWSVPPTVFSAEQDEIILSDNLTYDFITHNADYFTDKKELLTIKEVTSPEYAGSFRRINSEGFLSGKDRVVWLRFRMANKAQAVHQWFMEYDFFKSGIELEVYVPADNGTYRVRRAYPGISSPELDIRNRNYVFTIDLSPGKSKTFYVKATISTELYLVLKIWHPVAFQDTIMAEQLFIGIFLGIMIIMAFYNFFLFFSFRDLSYVYYILFILCLSILQLNNHHLLSEWFTALARYDVLVTTIFKFLSFMSFLFFSRSFLSIKKYFPRVDKIFIFSIAAVIGTGLLAFSFDFFKAVNGILLACSGILILLLASLILVKGNRTAVFFLLAMAVLIGFGILVLIPVESFYVKSIDFLVPFFIDIGSLLMIVLFSFGLGYRINLLQKEKEQVDRLKEIDIIKSRFFANISHEFRTPLTLIAGPLEDMLSECSEPRLKNKYEMMMRNSGRLLGLVNQLLDLSRLESGKMKITVCEQNIVSFLKGIVGCFGYITGQKQQRFMLQTELDEILVFFDREKIEKICLNLLINAVKFTPAGGSILVHITKWDKGTTLKKFPEGYAQITIANPGPGIPAEQLDRIFEYFYQADNSSEHANTGTGIGLAIVKEFVALHHGSVNVTSRIDGQDKQNLTTFTVRLPLGRQHFKTHEIVQTNPAANNFGLTRQIRDMCEEEGAIDETEMEFPADVRGDIGKDLILIIEDNADVRKYLRDGLVENFDVIEASDGEEGVKTARKTIPDLIVSDVMMPGMDGYKVTQTLKNGIDTSHIPIVLLTAKASDESIIRGLGHGADDYITKPFNLEIVKARILNLITLRHQLQEKIQKQLLLQPSEISFTPIDCKFINNLHDIIEKNIADPDFNIETLAAGLFLSKPTLNRKINALTGQSSNQYIQSYRLKKAAQLLQANFGNVTEVCYAVGFSSSAYFTKCFKEAFHLLPSRFHAVKAS